MANKQTRKTSGEIKTEILHYLKKGPLSTKRLSELLNSNWSTINNYLEELKHNRDVREIYSRENLRVYVRCDYPVFYGLPLDEKKMNDSLFLLSKIIEKWHKEKKQIINKTTMQKIAVNVVKNTSLDIPIVKFHYGKVLATYLEPTNYQDVIKIYKIKEPKNSDYIEKEIEKEIKKGNHTNIAWKEKKNQYETHSDMKIFNLSDSVHYILSNEKKSESKILIDLFQKIFLEIPITQRYSYLFEKYHEFIGGVYFIFNSKEFDNLEHKKNLLKEILDVFNSLWQALTTEFFFEDIEMFINEDFKEIIDFIRDSKTNSHYFDIEEKLSNLLDYKKTLNMKEIKLNETEEKMLNILLEGANEE